MQINIQWLASSLRLCAFAETMILPQRRKGAKVASVILMLLSCAAIAQAQTGSSSNDSQTRERRAPVTSNDGKESDEKSAVMNDVVVNTQPAQSNKTVSPVAAPPAKDKGRTGDRVSLLRAQISGAKSEIERVRLQRTLVDYLVALNRHSEAVTELRAMLGAERLDAASYYNIGNGLARLGDAEKAVEAYRKAIAARQDNYPRALNNLGVVLLGLGRLDEAYDALVLAIKQQNFRYAEASYNLGKLYAARDEADLAISEWTRALTVQPDHVDASIALARALAATGKAADGLEVIDATLKRTGANDRLAAVRAEIASSSAAHK